MDFLLQSKHVNWQLNHGPIVTNGTNVQPLFYVTTNNVSQKIVLIQQVVLPVSNVLTLNVSQRYMQKITVVIVINGLHALLISNAHRINAGHLIADIKLIVLKDSLAFKTSALPQTTQDQH